MNIIQPQIAKKLLRINGFSSYAQDFLLDELPILAIKSCEEQIEGADFFKIDIRKSIFKNCAFHRCNFEKASFVDVVFHSCDLSNSKFAGIYFERCRFVSCKCIV
jgi:uncharacterized protein YjbI with pentapeptide repeats